LRGNTQRQSPGSKEERIDWINHTICRVENLPMEVDGSGTSSSSDSVPESRSRSKSDCFNRIEISKSELKNQKIPNWN
jgi:hypothetical protein